MKNKTKIVSDGTANGTRVTQGGVLLKNVTKIEILPLEPGGVVQARLTFTNVELDLVAEPLRDEKLGFLQWVYDRLIYVHKENPNVDYMLKLNDIVHPKDSNETVKKP